MAKGIGIFQGSKMRNKISGIIIESDNKLVLQLYEINNSFPHHHRVFWSQSIEPEEVVELIDDLIRLSQSVTEYLDIKLKQELNKC